MIRTDLGQIIDCLESFGNEPKYEVIDAKKDGDIWHLAVRAYKAKTDVVILEAAK